MLSNCRECRYYYQGVCAINPKYAEGYCTLTKKLSLKEITILETILPISDKIICCPDFSLVQAEEDARMPKPSIQEPVAEAVAEQDERLGRGSVRGFVPVFRRNFTRFGTAASIILLGLGCCQSTLTLFKVEAAYWDYHDNGQVHLEKAANASTVKLAQANLVKALEWTNEHYSRDSFINRNLQAAAGVLEGKPSNLEMPAGVQYAIKGTETNINQEQNDKRNIAWCVEVFAVIGSMCVGVILRCVCNE